MSDAERAVAEWRSPMRAISTICHHRATDRDPWAVSDRLLPYGERRPCAVPRPSRLGTGVAGPSGGSADKPAGLVGSARSHRRPVIPSDGVPEIAHIRPTVDLLYDDPRGVMRNLLAVHDRSARADVSCSRPATTVGSDFVRRSRAALGCGVHSSAAAFTEGVDEM